MGIELAVQLEAMPLFSGLTHQQLQWMAARMYTRVFPSEENIIIVGTPGEIVYFVVTGIVKVYSPQLDGSEVIIDLLGPGSLVGEMSLLDQSARSASVITLEETQTAWMNGDDFRQALKTFPVLAFNLLKVLSTRLRLTNEHMQALASLEVHGRVAHQLLAFAEFYGRALPGGAVKIDLRLPQGEIAELVSASRKRVNQAMGDLKREGLISFDSEQHVTLLNSQALKDMCGKY
jgi:CRP/FNR family transcriptional regulator, cyclic AMP receptor protein